MPPVKHCKYILFVLNEIGYCNISAEGVAPLSFTDIKSYAELTSTNLGWWDVLILKELSTAYVVEFKNKDENTFAPYQGEFKPQSFKMILDKLKK